MSARPLRFRVWDERFKQWAVPTSDQGVPRLWLGSDGSFEFSSLASVTKETAVVEQFTGMVDKTGREVFEGDLCRHEAGWTAMATASWWLVDGAPNHAFTYAFTIPGTCYREDFRYVQPSQIEVVGNVHEQPDLMREERTRLDAECRNRPVSPPAPRAAWWQRFLSLSASNPSTSTP